MPFFTRSFPSQGDLVDFANGAASRGWIRAPAPTPQTVADGDIFRIPDGSGLTEFEFDVAGDGANGSGTAIDISAATTAAEVASAMETAINGVAAGLTVTATAVGEYVQLVNDAVGDNDGQIEFGTTNVIGYQKQDMQGGSVALAQANVVSIYNRDGDWYLVWFV